MNYGRYQIMKEVGRGSMGVVFQARDPRIDRLVAVKVLRTDRVDGENFVHRFLKEAKVIGRLTHPNIVAIYDVGEEQGTVYIAMEFLEGVPLSQLVQKKLPEIKEVVALGVQLAEALEYAHQKGVVHRDVKPSNIIVQSDGQIKITDFGIAHVEDSTATLQTQAGDIMGTPAYMSPEQVLNQPVDGRSDIFSLGIILYELSTGRRPFGGVGKSLVTVFNDIVGVTPQEPAVFASVVPRGLSRLIMKALQKDPEKRFQSGKDLAKALKDSFDSSVPEPAEPPGDLAPKRTLRHALTLGAVAATAASIIQLFPSMYKNTPAPASVAVTKLSPGTADYSGFPATANDPSAAPRIPDAAKSAPAATNVTGPRYPVTTGAAITAAVPLPSLHGNMAQRTNSAASKQNVKKKPTAMASSRHGRQTILTREKSRRHTPKEAVKTLSKRAAPAVSVPQSGSEAVTVSPTVGPAVAAKPLQRFAFLKVGSSPPGARVSINGAQQGTTPMIVKLDLGEYKVRLSRPGYGEVDRLITLDKMQVYPMVENLKPVE